MNSEGMTVSMLAVSVSLLISDWALAEDPVSDPRDAAVEMFASVSEALPRITIHWNPSRAPSTSLSVFRRRVGDPDWGEGVELPSSATSFADPSAEVSTLYEYKVTRTQENVAFPAAEGRIWSGVNLPVVEERGRLILVVDQTVAGALGAEIDRLIADLVGDGWRVARTDVSRSATLGEVKDAIRGWYFSDPLPTRAVLLLGRIAVPYSGQVCPDGHYEDPPMPHHRGAWPTDAYYGDMDGIWTDVAVNHAVANLDGTRNHNVPGDGKFDVSLLTGEHLPELVVGRIDFANLTGIANGLSETELLRRYLDRHHAFRHRLPPFETLGECALIDDDTFGPDEGEAFASGGWTSGVALFGNANTAAGDWVPTLQSQDCLLAYGCGPGEFGGASGVSGIHDFRDTPCRAVFTMLFGSFFGDWDSADNYLRAPLVGRSDSHGLVSVWSGIPDWRLFPLAAGGTMADAYRYTVFEVNQASGPLPPEDASWRNPDQAHVAILGDPVLRTHPVKPVTGLGAVRSGNQVTLSWGVPSGESDLVECRIYRSESVFGPYQGLGVISPTTTTFLDAVPRGGRWHYLVRAVKRQTTASAVYDNPAQGVHTEILVPSFDYSTWIAGESEGAEMADPNGDGVSNLLAYALGADSARSDATHLEPVCEGGASFLVPFSERPDLEYRVELSTDLVIWYVVAIRAVGGVWALNETSGYPGQAGLSMEGTSSKRFLEERLLMPRFWRLRVIH